MGDVSATGKINISLTDKELLERFANENKIMSEQLKIAVDALSKWVKWEKQQIVKYGPYQGKEINELFITGYSQEFSKR